MFWNNLTIGKKFILSLLGSIITILFFSAVAKVSSEHIMDSSDAAIEKLWQLINTRLADEPSDRCDTRIVFDCPALLFL